MMRSLLFFLAFAFVAGCSAGGGPSGGGSPKGMAPAADSWDLVLKVSVHDEDADGGIAYNRLVAGQDDKASEDFDTAWDVRAFLAGPVKAYFAHEGESGYDTGPNLWQDFRSKSLPAEWAFDVVSEAGRPVTVYWKMPEGEVSCDSNRFTLEDADGRLGTTDLCSQESLIYNGDGAPRHFVLKVT